MKEIAQKISSTLLNKESFSFSSDLNHEIETWMDSLQLKIRFVVDIPFHLVDEILQLKQMSFGMVHAVPLIFGFSVEGVLFNQRNEN